VKEILRFESGDSSFLRQAHDTLKLKNGLVIPKGTTV
jgi:hypothetical protein